MLSIVTSLYQSQDYIQEFYERTLKVINKLQVKYEFIFVNDGSTDKSLFVAKKLFEKDPNVRILDLSRNFGQHAATVTGLEHAKGDYVFTIDCDLEEPPEALEVFYKKITDSTLDLDFVRGVKINKWTYTNFFISVSSYLFYRLFVFLSDLKRTDNVLMMRLMTRRYLNALLQYKEKSIFFDGACSLVGFNMQSIKVKKTSKKSTHYSFFKRVQLAIKAIIFFSNKPLILISLLGIFISFFSFAFAIKAFIMKLVYDMSPVGWTSLIITVCFMGGLMMTTIGILGLYLAAIFSQLKNRPIATIKDDYKS